METIGDSYLVVSGAPRRNGLNHSAEIATIALHALMASEEIVLSDMPEQKVRLTIGINTGKHEC